MSRVWVAAFAAVSLALPTGATSAVRIPLVVSDDSGIGYSRDPVTSGIPIADADTASAWALFDGISEVPLQTTLLRGRRPSWLLLDFAASVPPHGATTYTLVSQPPHATPLDSLHVAFSAADSTWLVSTGPLEVEIGVAPFDLIRRAWLRRSSTDTTRALVVDAPPASAPGNLALVPAGAAPLSGRGRPTRVEWEDRGPLRGTLRVDGAYGDPAHPLLRYTTRLTFWAGRAEVKVEHVLRNSFEGPERNVKVRSATIAIGAAGASARARRSGDEVVLAVAPNAGAQLELVPRTITVTTGFAHGRTDTKVSTDDPPAGNGGIVIPDWSYFGATAFLEFGAADKSKLSDAEARLLSPPFAYAAGAWYSDLGAFATEHFGTYEDEKRAYQRWGWKWPGTGHVGEEHKLPRPDSDYDPSWTTIDGAEDPESDDLWMLLVMYARTGQRTYLDRAIRWARYKKWENAYRTDGFPYAWDDYWEGPAKVARAPQRQLPSPAVFTRMDSLYLVNDAKHGREDTSHSWNGGLVDAYFLLGDRDALAAALDIAERSRRLTAPWKVGAGGDAGASTRFPSRAYLNFLRAWEATNDPQWRRAADHVRENLLDSRTYDSRGFWYTPTADMGKQAPPAVPPTPAQRYPGGRYVSPFQIGTTVVALYRDFVLTGDPRLRTRLLDVASFANAFGCDTTTGYTGDCVVVDWPKPGQAAHVSYSAFRGYPKPLAWSYMSSSNSFIDALDIGWRLSGNDAYLRRARALWDRTSKGPANKREAGPNEVGHFENSLQGWDAKLLMFPESGDLTTVQDFFYDAARNDIAGGATGAAAGTPH